MGDIIVSLIDYAESMGTGAFVVLYLAYTWMKAYRKNRRTPTPLNRATTKIHSDRNPSKKKVSFFETVVSNIVTPSDSIRANNQQHHSSKASATPTPETHPSPNSTANAKYEPIKPISATSSPILKKSIPSDQMSLDLNEKEIL